MADSKDKKDETSKEEESSDKDEDRDEDEKDDEKDDKKKKKSGGDKKKDDADEDEDEDEDEDDKGEDDADGEDGDGDGDDKKKKKKSPLQNPKVRIGLLIGGIVLLVVLIVLWIWYETDGRYQQSTNDAYIGADQAGVTARVSGWVTEIAVGDNQQVDAGQLLARLDPREYAGKMEQSLGQVAQYRGEVAQYQAQIAQQLAMVAEKRETVRQYEAQMRQYLASERYYQNEVNRYAPLVASGAEPAEKLDQNLSSRDQARAQVDQARAQRDSTRADVVYQERQIPVLRTQRAQSEGKVQNALGSLETNRVDYEQTTIAAPIAGRVGNRTLRVGQYVQAGTQLMTVVPLRFQYLDANFKETQIGLMRVGQPATIKIDALPGMTISGTVDSFQPGTGNRFALVPQNNATGNFTKIVQRVTVRIRIDDDAQMVQRVLVPGLSVEVTVDTRGAKDDRKEIKREDKDTQRERKEERKDAVEQQKGRAASGAGGG